MVLVMRLWRLWQEFCSYLCWSSYGCRAAPKEAVRCCVTFVSTVTRVIMIRFSSLLDILRSTTPLSSLFHAVRAVSAVTCVSSRRVSSRPDSWTYSFSRTHLRHYRQRSLTGSDPPAPPPTLCGECRGLPLPPFLANPLRLRDSL